MDSAPSNHSERLITIRNPHGLHMRPAVEFIDRANGFASEVQVQKGELIVDGKSIYQITQLIAKFGTELKLIVKGTDAEQAIEVLAEILERESYDNDVQAAP
ncbi:MAG: HPr family phosphocarrier protein [Sedimentisphaerales bacterium]|nr:HPr family phosphocarrier protein [Sedimentisphaerales bacterium]